MTPSPPPADDRPPLRPETLAVHGGRSADGGALAPVLWSTSTFSQRDLDESLRQATRPQEANFYSRHGNPTVAAFQEAVAGLEGAEAAQAFASGMGAISSVVLALCSQGSHVVAQTQLYTATSQLLRAVCPRFGIEVTFVDAVDPDAWRAAVRPGTMVVFAETPTNPCLQLVDLDALGAIPGPIKVVDSTFGGPLVQRRSTTASTWSCTRPPRASRATTTPPSGWWPGRPSWCSGCGATTPCTVPSPSPFDALNGLRGLRTLGVRVRQQAETAERLALLLEEHPDVEAVNYPGLDSHPQRAVAKRQMAHGGTIVSFVVRGGIAAGRRFAEGCRLARLAPSLGGPETLVTHPASTTAAGLTPDERRAMGIPEGLVRVSVGLEHPDDVLADVTHALRVAAAGA